MRSLAVAGVVLGHLFQNYVPRGFLGVDIFFVISGYVITQLLVRNYKTHQSNFFLTFYAKRIRRIIPALTVTVGLTLLATFIFVTRIDGAIGNTAAYSLLGVSNMFLWWYSKDYFGYSASQNPFTHTWSLGVEEQFYALYPVLFFLTWKIAKELRISILKIFIGLISISSLILNFLLMGPSTNFAFYGMPTRAWELGFGALIFLSFAAESKPINSSKIKPILAFFALIALVFLDFGPTILSQVIIVLFTGYLLIPKAENQLSKFLSNQILVWVGVRSFGIYLIHWPLLVITNYYFGFNELKNIFCLFSTLILSALMFKYIETPFRNGRFKTTSVKTIGLGIPITLVLSASIYYGAPILSETYSNILPRLMGVTDVPKWNSSPCSNALNIAKLVNPISNCLGGSTKSKSKFVYLIGDSHADQLIPMVRSSFFNRDYKVKNLNMEDGRDFPYGEFTSNTNSQSLRFLESSAKLGDVVILAFHRGHLNPSRDEHISISQNIGITSKTRNLVANLNRFAEKMSGKGVKIILVKDTPLLASAQPSQSCALQIKLFHKSICRVSRAQDMHTRYLQNQAFEEIVRLNRNVMTYDPFDEIYKSSNYFDAVDKKGNYLMWDWNHITPYLSRKLSINFSVSTRNFLKSG